jgi:hypoxanthine phosphoribosyltransferase
MNLDEAKCALAEAECLFDRSQIDTALDWIADHITRELEGSNPVALCIMNGGLIIAGHLLTRLTFPLQVDYMHVTRYHEQTHGGDLHWHKKPSLSLKDRTVLLIDDILDEGHTLAAILAHCRAQGATRVTAAVLVEKRHARKQARMRANYVGLTIDDRYVFGFGMDYKGYLRNLPGIYAVKTA